MPQPNDLSRSLFALDQNSTIIAVVEMRKNGNNQNDYLTGKAPYKSCKPSVPKAIEGSGIGAGGRTARNRILPMVASGGPGNLL